MLIKFFPIQHRIYERISESLEPFFWLQTSSVLCTYYVDIFLYSYKTIYKEQIKIKYAGLSKQLHVYKVYLFY